MTRVVSRTASRSHAPPAARRGSRRRFRRRERPAAAPVAGPAEPAGRAEVPPKPRSCRCLLPRPLTRSDRTTGTLLRCSSTPTSSGSASTPARASVGRRSTRPPAPSVPSRCMWVAPARCDSRIWRSRISSDGSRRPRSSRRVSAPSTSRTSTSDGRRPPAISTTTACSMSPSATVITSGRTSRNPENCTSPRLSAPRKSTRRPWSTSQAILRATDGTTSWLPSRARLRCTRTRRANHDAGRGTPCFQRSCPNRLRSRM